MSNVIEERIVTLSTASADAILQNGTFKSDVLFDFKHILKDDKTIEKASISIINAQIPLSYYNVNIYNNIIKILLGVTTYTINLTVGNYTSTTLMTLLQTNFTSAGLTGFTFSYSTTTGKMTMSYTSSFSILYSGSTALGVLGYSTTSNTTGTTLIGIYPLNLLGTLRIRVLSTQLSCYNYDSSIKGGVSLLGTIPVECPPYSVILYDNYTKSATELKELNINQIDIQLVDDNNNLLQLNNIDWCLTLAIYIERTPTEKSTSSFNDVILKQNMDLINSLVKSQGNTEDNQDNQDLGNKQPKTQTDDLYDMFYENGITL
jgi:hypothetical protein